MVATPSLHRLAVYMGEALEELEELDVKSLNDRLQTAAEH